MTSLIRSSRRGFLLGFSALVAAPALVRASSLMPVVPIKPSLPGLAPEEWMNLQGRWLVRASIVGKNPNLVEELVKLCGYSAHGLSVAMFDEDGAAYLERRQNGRPPERIYGRDLPNSRLIK